MKYETVFKGSKPYFMISLESNSSQDQLRSLLVRTILSSGIPRGLFRVRKGIDRSIRVARFIIEN